METLLFNWYKNEECLDSKITQFEQIKNVNLPAQYKKFLEWSNGGEGKLGNNYLMLWKIEDIKQYNEDYRIQFYLSEFILGIGTDGGGICYAIDLRNDAIVKVSLGDLDVNEMIVLSESFDSFLGKALYQDFSDI